MLDRSDAQRMVRETVAEQFADLTDYDIEVSADVDSDGDPILRVTIIVDPQSSLQGGDMAGFVRHLRSRLADQDVDLFPIVSYVSKADVGKRRLAAV